MKHSQIMYGVKCINSPEMFALYMYRQSGVIHLADSKRRGEPRRVVVTWDDGKPAKKKAKR